MSARGGYDAASINEWDAAGWQGGWFCGERHRNRDEASRHAVWLE